MKWVRCKDCGMSIKVKDYDFTAVCPICGNKVYIATAERVRSMEDYYNSSNFNSTDHDHINDMLRSNKNANNFGKNNSINVDPKTAKNISTVIIIIFFIIFFLLAAFANGV